MLAGGATGLRVPLPQASTGSLVMVNFYNDYVTCGDTATLANVAGEVGAWVGGRWQCPPALLTRSPPCPQITWTM